METIQTLNANILAITLKINAEHPELSKYLNEMPVTIPTEKSPEINLESLREYYESLTKVLKKYKVEHPRVFYNIDKP